MDVAMIEDSLVVVDVMVVLVVDVAVVEIHREVFPEIPMPGVLTVKDRDTPQPTASLNTRTPPPQ